MTTNEWRCANGKRVTVSIFIRIYLYFFLTLHYTVAELVQSACPSNVYRLVYLSNLAIKLNIGVKHTVILDIVRGSTAVCRHSNRAFFVILIFLVTSRKGSIGAIEHNNRRRSSRPIVSTWFTDNESTRSRIQVHRHRSCDGTTSNCCIAQTF